MIRKILKWIGIVLGSLAGLLVLAFIVLYLIGSVKWNQIHGRYDVPVETILIPTDQAAITRGEPGQLHLIERWLPGPLANTLRSSQRADACL
jgi:hypothetical protein